MSPVVWLLLSTCAQLYNQGKHGFGFHIFSQINAKKFFITIVTMAEVTSELQSTGVSCKKVIILFLVSFCKSVSQRQLKRHVKVTQLLNNKRNGKFTVLTRVQHPKQTCVLSAFPLSASTVAFLIKFHLLKYRSHRTRKNFKIGKLNILKP